MTDKLENLTIEAAIAYVLEREAGWEDYRLIRVIEARRDGELIDDLIELVTEGGFTDCVGTERVARSYWGVWLQDGRLYGEC
jgi:hypothetical protein